MGNLIKIFVAVLFIVFFAMQLTGLKSEYGRARLKALNEIPSDSFDDVVSVAQGKTAFTARRLKAYLDYAQLMSRLAPQRADVWGLAGFCFFQTGDYEHAIASYAKAASLEPQFFGFHYNLAFIHFKKGQYDRSVEELQKALLCDPRESLIYILSSSKIYALMMIARINNFGISAEEQLKDGYQKMYQLMAADQYHLKMEMPFPGEEQLSLEGF